MDVTREKRLIALVHAGVVDDKGWEPFVDALRIATGAVHANLTLRRNDAPLSELTSYASGGPLEDSSRLYFSSYHRDDPLPYYRLAPGRAYALSDLFEPDDITGQDQIRQLLGTFGASELLIERICEPGGANAWLTVARQTEPFGASDRDLLETLGQHLAIALLTYVRLADATARASAYASAMGRLNVGMVTLAADGRIIDADPVVNRLIAERAIMSRDPTGRLALAAPAAVRALTAALRDFVAEPSSRPRAVRLSEAERADMLLLPVANRPATGQLTPVLQAYVHIERQPAADGVEGLIEMFGLTRSEARLALALGEGQTLSEAATRMGVTLQTARTYSKRIFQKTGTRRQAELVRTLLTSTLSFA